MQCDQKGVAVSLKDCPFLSSRCMLTTPQGSLNTRATLHISPPNPESVPIASSTCVNFDSCATAAAIFKGCSFHLMQCVASM